jgi:rubrerythrin
MAGTQGNLQAAFAGESQANRRYLAFAKKAEEDGKPRTAKLFRAAAEAETIHAHNHLRLMGGIKSTAENVQAAIDGETYEATEMYPTFAAAADQENADEAQHIFGLIGQAEAVHASLYKQAFAALQTGGDLEADQLFLCTVCGNVVTGAPPSKCPICGSPKSKFVEVQ